MKAVLNVKTDLDVKNAARKIAEDLGLSLSAIVNASLKQFVRSRELYFSSAPKMSSYLESLLGGVEKDIPDKANLSRPFSSVEDATNYLHSGDK